MLEPSTSLPGLFGSQRDLARLGDIRIIICPRNPIINRAIHYRANLWTGNSKGKDLHEGHGIQTIGNLSKAPMGVEIVCTREQ